MDSALRPRDIQARIRAGASPEQVAEAAGVPIERIDAFAAPVIAERDYIAGLARTNPVRRRGETTSHRTLRNAVADALAAMCTPEAMEKKYGLKDAAPLLFAVGDGNHSLATAKACYEEQKKGKTPEEYLALPARYALVEVVNNHDDALQFEPIHRVLFGVDHQKFMDAFRAAYPNAMRLDYLPQGEVAHPLDMTQAVRGKPVVELFQDFFTKMNGRPLTVEETVAVKRLREEASKSE